MEVILISNFSSIPRQMRIGRFAVQGLIVAIMILSGLLVYVGFLSGLAMIEGRTETALVSWREELQAQRRKVDEVVKETDRQLAVLASRVGQMQARVIRLDGLGERLVELSGLEQDEFGFGKPPPEGGPQVRNAGEQADVSDVMHALERLADGIEDLEPKLGGVQSLLMNKKLANEARLEGQPVRQGWISSYFGLRADPFTGHKAFHEGIDFAGKMRSVIVAVAAGIVTRSGYRSGYGHTVQIAHSGGYSTLYAHNYRNLVEVGAHVRRGQPIALMGSSGRSTGAHVHFEVLREGKAVDPTRYVQVRH